MVDAFSFHSVTFLYLQIGDFVTRSYFSFANSLSIPYILGTKNIDKNIRAVIPRKTNRPVGLGTGCLTVEIYSESTVGLNDVPRRFLGPPRRRTLCKP